VNGANVVSVSELRMAAIHQDVLLLRLSFTKVGQLVSLKQVTNITQGTDGQTQTFRY